MWAFTVGCSREGREMLQDDGQVEFSIMMGTKSGSPGDVTYRALLLNRNSLLYTGFNGREDKRASGIGLYLCKRIADNLGHKISAESAPGVGTKMILDLRKADLTVE